MKKLTNIFAGAAVAVNLGAFAHDVNVNGEYHATHTGDAYSVSGHRQARVDSNNQLPAPVQFMKGLGSAGMMAADLLNGPDIKKDPISRGPRP